MKAFTKILAVVIAAGAAATLAGCASPVNSRVATGANWNVRTQNSVERNSIDYWRTHKEVAEYGISFKEGLNRTYSISYDTDSAKYTTEFYIDKTDYDWAATDIPEEYRRENEKEPVYVYKTTLNISGKFILSAGGEKEFSDSLVSVCKFRLSGKNLQPVYSLQEEKDCAPNALNAATVESMYVESDVVLETFYNYDCTEALVKTTDNKDSANSGEKKIALGTKQGYSVFDNSQLSLALRAFSLSAGTRTFNVCVPKNGGAQVCYSSAISPIELNGEDETQAKIISALENAPKDYIFFDGSPANEEETKKNARYTSVSISINANLKGSAPVLWYAALENVNANSTRCVLLKRDDALPFGLGTTSYYLKTLNVAEI